MSTLVVLLAASLILGVGGVAPSLASGPDVIVGFVDDGREDARQGSKIGLTASTNSCNVGDAPLNWYRLPDNRHPAITLNLYRLLDGRMVQLAKSWVKHGFFATNQDACSGIPEMTRTCRAGTGGNQLRPGCSDYYGEDLNSDPRNLGPRSRIANSATGEFDGNTAQDLTGYPPSQPAERILLVEEDDLRTPNARFFVEAHYVSTDDALAGNARNNVTYREVKPLLRAGAWVLKNEKPEVRTQPAVSAWGTEGAQLAEIEAVEGPAKTYVILGSRASSAPGAKFRYEYLVYNMNSDLAVQSFSVPATGVDPATIGFSAPSSNGEIWSNEPWQHRVEGGRVVWTTKSHTEDRNANAIRWGSTYNFWFISDVAPRSGDAVIGRFKPSTAVPSTAVTRVVAPVR